MANPTERAAPDQVPAHSHRRWPRRDWDKHRADVRATNRAFDAAVRRLISEQPERYAELYAEQAAARGVQPRSPKLLTERELIELELAGLRAQLASIWGPEDDDG